MFLLLLLLLPLFTHFYECSIELYLLEPSWHFCSPKVIRNKWNFLATWSSLKHCKQYWNKLVRRLWELSWEKLCKIHGSDNLLVLLDRKNICSYLFIFTFKKYIVHILASRWLKRGSQSINIWKTGCWVCTWTYFKLFFIMNSPGVFSLLSKVFSRPDLLNINIIYCQEQSRARTRENFMVHWKTLSMPCATVQRFSKWWVHSWIWMHRSECMKRRLHWGWPCNTAGIERPWFWAAFQGD